MSVQRTAIVTRSNPTATAFTEVTPSAPLPVGAQPTTNRIGTIASQFIYFEETTTPLGISASVNGTTRDVASGAAPGNVVNSTTSGMGEVRIAAESDVSFTLALEVSRDTTTWLRIKSTASAAVAGGGHYAEIIHKPTHRYFRLVVVNGGVAQTRLLASSAYGG